MLETGCPDFPITEAECDDLNNILNSGFLMGKDQFETADQFFHPIYFYFNSRILFSGSDEILNDSEQSSMKILTKNPSCDENLCYPMSSKSQVHNHG